MADTAIGPDKWTCAPKLSRQSESLDIFWGRRPDAWDGILNNKMRFKCWASRETP